MLCLVVESYDGKVVVNEWLNHFHKDNARKYLFVMTNNEVASQ